MRNGMLAIPVGAIVLMLAPQAAQARNLWVCTAQGVYESCNAAGTCNRLPVMDVQYNADQQIAQTLAVNGCHAKLSMSMTNAQIWADVRRLAQCSLQRCWEESEESIRAARGEGPAPAPQPEAAPAPRQPGPDAKPAGELAACKPAIELMCDVCGAASEACKRAPKAKGTAAECREVVTGLKQVKQLIATQPETKAMLGEACAEFARGMVVD